MYKLEDENGNIKGRYTDLDEACAIVDKWVAAGFPRCRILMDRDYIPEPKENDNLKRDSQLVGKEQLIRRRESISRQIDNTPMPVRYDLKDAYYSKLAKLNNRLASINDCIAKGE